jgi:hypothetical protein
MASSPQQRVWVYLGPGVACCFEGKGTHNVRILDNLGKTLHRTLLNVTPTLNEDVTLSSLLLNHAAIL